MKNKPKTAVLGGDLRHCAAAEELSRRGFDVYACGLCTDYFRGAELKLCDSMTEAVNGARAVILPLPASSDGELLNCPCLKCSERTALAEIIGGMDGGAVLLGGRIPQNAADTAAARGIKVYDYFLSEKLQIKNAYITAEAALSIAMNSLDRCIKGARTAVIGSGRIARLLSDLLLKIGARVAVAARNADSLVYFGLAGCETLSTCAAGWYGELISGFDVIFNTVPSPLFDRAFLERADKSTLLIELASAPGGIDVCSARELSSNVRWAPSLPGKYAPHSAGKLIAECVCEILGECEEGFK